MLSCFFRQLFLTTCHRMLCTLWLLPRLFFLPLSRLLFRAVTHLHGMLSFHQASEDCSLYDECQRMRKVRRRFRKEFRRRHPSSVMILLWVRDCNDVGSFQNRPLTSVMSSPMPTPRNAVCWVFATDPHLSTLRALLTSVGCCACQVPIFSGQMP